MCARDLARYTHPPMAAKPFSAAEEKPFRTWNCSPPAGDWGDSLRRGGERGVPSRQGRRTPRFDCPPPRATMPVCVPFLGGA